MVGIGTCVPFQLSRWLWNFPVSLRAPTCVWLIENAVMEERLTPAGSIASCLAHPSLSSFSSVCVLCVLCVCWVCVCVWCVCVCVHASVCGEGLILRCCPRYSWKVPLSAGHHRLSELYSVACQFVQTLHPVLTCFTFKTMNSVRVTTVLLLI